MVLYYILVPLAWLVWHIGFRIRVEGRENLKKVQTKGYILAPTHVSAIDPVFIVVTRWGRRMVVFAKKELFEINALLTWFFRCCGAVCVRGTKDEMAAIEQTVEACKNGKTLLIFPEGTREKEGKLLSPKSGLFVIAAEAGVDVVPCRIFYDTPDGKMHLFCRVRVIYGEPMPAAQFAMESRRDTKKLRANKQALLEAWEAFKMRRSWFVNDFCQPIYELFMAEAVALGRINAPGFHTDPLLREAWCGARWIGPVQGSLDPKKEAEAALMLTNRAIKTNDQVTREMSGGDWEENVDQLARENELLAAIGSVQQPAENTPPASGEE